MPAKKPGRSHTGRNENETAHGATHGAIRTLGAALALLVACGGSVAPTPSPDASGDASDPFDAPGDATPDVAADPCACLPDALYCHGVRRPDAESCSKCGYPCNSTPDAGGE